MNTKIVIPIIIVIVVVSAIISAPYFYQKPSGDVQWVISGPFAIDKPKYKLGENIFISVHGLKPGEIGNMVFVRPGEKTWASIPFNGTSKSNFNYYLKPDTSAPLEIYKAEDLVGQWTLMFQGVKYDPIHFEMLNEFIKGGEEDLAPINPNATQTVGPIQK